MTRGHNPAWRQMGADGTWTLTFSSLLILLTGGLSLLLTALHVWRTAQTARTDVRADDWIVVPGRRLLGSAVTLEYAARLRRAEALYRSSPHARILVLGGHTSEGPFSEAQQGRNFLLQRGIPGQAVRTEDGSQHTLENLQNGRRMLDGDNDCPWVLVSSRYHLARCHALAEGMALPHRLCAAEDRWTWSPLQCRRLCVEAFYLHWYWAGKAWSTLTRNHKSLARIS